MLEPSIGLIGCCGPLLASLWRTLRKQLRGVRYFRRGTTYLSCRTLPFFFCSRFSWESKIFIAG
jgi:hypothetical protein